MTACPVCAVPLMEGAIVCPACSTTLVAPKESKSTVDMGLRVDWASPTPTTTLAEPAMPVAEIQARLFIFNSGRTIEFSVGTAKVLGRSGKPAGDAVELDLSGDGAAENGVSRRHARLFFVQGRCYLEDLNSSNGTFLN